MSKPVPPALIICMGVSGSGKSTLGQNLANALGVPFYDGDDLHPTSNVAKMSKGIPLTDADREPWLALIRSTADRICEAGDLGKGQVKGVVIACSSLKKYYRDILRGRYQKSHRPPPAKDIPEDHPMTDHVDTENESNLLEQAASQQLKTYFVYIKGRREELDARMKARKNHFMKASMLDSQLKTLEDPSNEEGVVVVDLDTPPEKQIQDGVAGLAKLGFHELHVVPAADKRDRPRRPSTPEES